MSGLRALFCCGGAAAPTEAPNVAPEPTSTDNTPTPADAEPYDEKLCNDADVDRQSIASKYSRVEELPPRLPEKMEMKMEMQMDATEEPAQQQDLQGWASAVFAAVGEASVDGGKTPSVNDTAMLQAKPMESLASRRDHKVEPLESSDSAFETHSGFNGWSASPRTAEKRNSAISHRSMNLTPVSTTPPMIPPLNLIPDTPITLAPEAVHPKHEPSSPARISIDDSETPTPRPASPATPRAVTPTLAAAPAMATASPLARASFSSHRTATTVTNSPRQSIDYFPTLDLKRSSTLSTISSIIAPAAAAAALARKASVKKPHSRPATPQTRYSQLSITRSSIDHDNRQSLDTAARTLSRLSTQYVPAEPITGALSSPVEEDLLAKYLNPLSNLILPSLDKMLANTSILGNYALWEDAMMLRREVRAFLASGAEEFVVLGEEGEVLEVKEKMLEQKSRSFVERGADVRKRGDTEMGGEEKKEKLGRVKSFWQERE